MSQLGWNWVWVGISYLVIVNLLAAFYFVQDKRYAEHGLGRVPEAKLLTLAMIGGAPAMMWARKRIRHKTRKQPFAALLTTIFVVQMIASIAVVIAFLAKP